MYVCTQAKKRFDCFFQIKYVANDNYHYGFKDLVEVVERYGGEYVKNKFLVKAELEALGVNGLYADNADYRDIIEDVVFNDMLGAMMISEADHSWYGLLKDNIVNHYTMGIDNYTTNMEKCMRLLNLWHLNFWFPSYVLFLFPFFFSIESCLSF